MIFNISKPPVIDKTFNVLLEPRSNFEEFCEETNLNGWYYMVKKNISKISRYFWATVIFASIFIACLFNYYIFWEFIKADVTITVESVTESLNKVLFPSIIICNQNQVRSSKKSL